MENYYTPSALLLPLAALSLASCGNQKKEETRQPNIIFMMTDDHTTQAMSCYGGNLIQTPNMDRIANEGIRFNNCYAVNALSGPSRACILTGKFSHENGFTDNASTFNGDQQTFPKLLQQAGYQTAIIGKWHLISEPQGFDHWSILSGQHEQGDYYDPDFWENGKHIVEKGYATDIITDKAIEFLEGRDKNKPFCLFIHHKAAHRNWLPELKYLSEYEDQTFELPENFYDDYHNRTAAASAEMSILKHMDIMYDTKMLSEKDDSRLKATYLKFISRMTDEERAQYDAFYSPLIQEFYKTKPQGKELAEWKYQRYMRDYAKVIKSLDDNVGRVLDYLDEKGLSDNTLVVYTSDQGFYMGEHGWFDKRFMYEESMHTPLTMRLPRGLNKRGDIPQLVQNIDYAPTFLELAGVSVPEDMQGVSLVPLLKGESPDDWRHSLYYHFYEYPAEHAVKRHYGVRTERYKLIHFYNDIDVWELYDLKEDPSEMNNLYGRESTEEITRQLKDELKTLQQQYGAPISL